MIPRAKPEGGPTLFPKGLLEPVCAAFARVVKEHRLRRGLSQGAMARMTGLNRSTIGRVEAGERVPCLDVQARMARALGMALSELLREAEERCAAGW